VLLDLFEGFLPQELAAAGLAGGYLGLCCVMDELYGVCVEEGSFFGLGLPAGGAGLSLAFDGTEVEVVLEVEALGSGGLFIEALIGTGLAGYPLPLLFEGRGFWVPALGRGQGGTEVEVLAGMENEVLEFADVCFFTFGGSTDLGVHNKMEIGDAG
jgi:hypothetical protein